MKRSSAILILILLALSSCGGVKTKAITVAPAALDGIPQSCKDQQKQYQPISTILSKSTYNAKAQNYRPIRSVNGFITSDFDGNGNIDLIFIERHKSDIRLISCINSKRKVTSFKVHETIKPDFQTISESIRLDGNSLVLSIDQHEHNWGGDSETSHYRYLKGKFILEKREIISHSGDGMRSDTYEFYDFVKKHFKSSSTCGSLEEGCKARSLKGTIVLSSIPATLSNQSKGYTRLVAK
jgi:hypothetical protein